MKNYTYRVEWKGRVYSGARPTRESALRARVERIEKLARNDPKRRTVLCRA